MKRLDIHRRFRPGVAGWLRLALMLAVLTALWVGIPNEVYDPANRQVIFALGVLGLWRYSWWLTHYVRSQIYARQVFPRIRRECEALWQSGWRPKRVLYMVTTFREVPSTTEAILAAIIRETRETNIPARVFFGTAEASDEEVITNYLRKYAQDVDLHLTFVRQNLPGKRIAIGLALRAMCRYGVRDDDICVFLDGDTYMEPGLLRKCLPVFQVRPDTTALTTDERAVLHGPKWMQWWTDMRMAQRQLAMQSVALSGKVLTLTGRCSVFRAKEVVEEKFIRTIEADYLDHWLWGRFRFLSGDDKSSVYALFCKPEGVTLRYVPDAVAVTTEYVEGGGLTRVRQNLLRWSGNMLRNGRRCIDLGPGRLGWFTWWCFVDQRLAMWTTLAGPLLAIYMASLTGLFVLWAAIVTVLTTRFLLSLFLYQYSGRVYMSFVWLLYFNQIVNASVKVYMSFRLAKQRWRNRGDQKSAEGKGWLARYQNFMGAFMTKAALTGFAYVLFAIFVFRGFPAVPIIWHTLGLR